MLIRCDLRCVDHAIFIRLLAELKKTYVINILLAHFCMKQEGLFLFQNAFFQHPVKIDQISSVH
jgi:hypothetical protein